MPSRPPGPSHQAEGPERSEPQDNATFSAF